MGGTESKEYQMSFVQSKNREEIVFLLIKSLPLKGVFKCETRIGSWMVYAEFIVIKGMGEPLLGRDTAMKLGVVKIDANVAAVFIFTISRSVSSSR